MKTNGSILCSNPRRGLLAVALVSLLMLLTFASATSASAQSVWSYKTMSNGCITITDYNGSSSSVTVPSYIDGKRVTSISPRAFQGVRTLRSVTVPETVTSIGAAAFKSCTSLNTVVLKNGLQVIGGDLTYNGGAFEGCVSLRSITIPSSVVEIQTNAFNGCTALSSLVIPKNVKSIGRYAFKNCTSMTTLTIQSGSTVGIGESAFTGCKSLKTASLPDGVSSIGGGAFSYCTSLRSITIPGTVSAISDGAFRGCTSLEKVTIQNGVTAIYGSPYSFGGAFADCTKLSSVSLPNTLKSIGYRAFGGCTSLKSISIPASVSEIGTSAFSGCTSLASVTLRDGLTSMGTDAFNGCKALRSITIPGTLGSIPKGAFQDCTALQSVVVKEGVSEICGGVDNLNHPATGAFQGCTSLVSLSLPNTLQTIGTGAFYGDRNLTSLTIPGSLVSMGRSAFAGCTSLTTLTIKDGAIEIGTGAFAGCASLHTVSIPGSIISVNSQAFYGCSALKSVVLKSGVVTIGNEAFYNCSNLSTVIIPDTVTTIGKRAFGNCPGVTLYVKYDSEAYNYAINNNIRYITRWYTVSFVSNGGSSVASQIVANGGKASKPSDPSLSGYTFVGWYSDKKLTKAYNFNTAVKSNITLYAKWKKIVPPTSFKDVPSGQWYTTWVTQAAKAGLMTGTKNLNGTYTGYFEPDRGITRAEVATVLWRIAGSPSSSYSVPSDVRGHWSQTAVAWCASKGIVTGYTSGPYRGMFRPDAQVTREELATMVYRFAKWSGVKTSNPPKKAFNSCGDTSCVSSWARDAMVWCSAAGVITGVQGGSKPMLCPQDGATRAMAAKIFVQTKKLASKSITPYAEEEEEVPVADAESALVPEIPTVKPELFFGTTEEGFAYVVVPDGYEAEDGTGFVIDQYYEQLGGRYVGPGAYITGYCGSAMSLVLPESVMAERQKLVEVVGATEVIQADTDSTPEADDALDVDSPVVDFDAETVAEPQSQMIGMDTAVTGDVAAQTDSEENRSSDGEEAESGSADTSNASAVDGAATDSAPVNGSVSVVSYEVVTESYDAPVVSANLSWGKGRTLDKEADHKVVTGTEEPTDQQAGMDDAGRTRIANLSIQRGCALGQLNASGNLITRITLLGDETLGGLPSLRILDLSNTQLESFDMAMFPALERLSLGNCPLSNEALQQLGTWLGATGLTADLNGAGPVSVNASDVPADTEQPSNAGDDTKVPADSEQPGASTTPEVPSGAADPTEPGEPAVPAPGDSMEPTEPEPPAQPGDTSTPETPAAGDDGSSGTPEMPGDSSTAQEPSEGRIGVPSESPELPDDPVASSDETAIVLTIDESLFGLAA